MKHKIVIEYDTDSGHISMTHPRDKVLAYGMIELAKEGMAKHMPGAKPSDEPLVKVPELVLPRG